MFELEIQINSWIWIALQHLLYLNILHHVLDNERPLIFLHKTKETQCSREWESQEAHQCVCNYVDPSSDAFVSELCVTSSGKDILPDLVAGWIDGQRRGQEIKLGGREGNSQNQKREGNERVTWTTVVTVLLITHHMVKDNMISSRKLGQPLDGTRKDDI